MKGDYSRFSFDRKKRYSAVLMQQGRLQLDADWNEQVQIAEHRNASFFRDLVGRSGAPQGNAMKLEVRAGVLTLTRGAYYIDGLLIENEKDVCLEMPEKAVGKFLYYLDAWTREVDASEDATLIDPAVGLETTARLKTEWAVRYEPVDKSMESLQETFLKGDWPESATGNWWQRLSTGKMTLKIGPEAAKIKDNRLYRIEVHADNCFKWSRDNASVCAEVAFIEGGVYKLSNNSTHIQDAFKGSAWIELYTPGGTGLMLDMSKTGNSFENGILTFSDHMPEMDKAVIRRWDGVFSAGKRENLPELNVVDLTFSTNEFYRSGDYWLILVRDGKIENWGSDASKQPDGVEHHFSALGFVNFFEDFISKSIEVTLTPLSVLFDPLTNPNLSTTGDVTIGGNLTLGTFSANKRLTVNGPTTITGALTAGSTVNITDNTTIGGTLTVNGTDGSSIGGSLTVNGNLSAKTAIVTGNTTIVGRLEVVKGLLVGLPTDDMPDTVFSELAVNLDTRIGFLDAKRNLTVHGKVTIGDSSNDSSVETPLTVYGDTIIGKSNVRRSLTVHGDVGIGGNTSIGSVNINRTLKVFGGVTIGDDNPDNPTVEAPLTVYGDTTIGKTNVRRSLTVHGDVGIGGNTSIGSAKINRTLKVFGGVTIGDSSDDSSDDSTVEAPLTVYGDTTIGSISATKTLTVHGDVGIGGNTSIGSDKGPRSLTVHGDLITAIKHFYIHKVSKSKITDPRYNIKVPSPSKEYTPINCHVIIAGHKLLGEYYLDDPPCISYCCIKGSSENTEIDVRIRYGKGLDTYDVDLEIYLLYIKKTLCGISAEDVE